MKQSSEIAELAKALSKCQGEIRGAIKDKKNPFFKSSYADLSSVWKACRDPLTNNGLSIIQCFETENDKQYIITKLMHESGQWISSCLALPHCKDVQSLGSAISYCKRYALSAIVGVYSIEEDDDAEDAMNRQKNESKISTESIPPKIGDLAIEDLGGRFENLVKDINQEELEKYLSYMQEKTQKPKTSFMARWCENPEGAKDHFLKTLEMLNPA